MKDHSLPAWVNQDLWQEGFDDLFQQERKRVLGELSFEFSREEILKRVTENRDKHQTEYTEAMEGYYITLEEQLLEIAKLARAQAKVAKESKDPERINFGVAARKPESHLGDYDRVIDMLSLAKDEVIELDENEFSTYVRDQWQWKQFFTETSNAYMAVAAANKR